MAKYLNVSPSTYQKWERGEVELMVPGAGLEPARELSPEGF